MLILVSSRELGQLRSCGALWRSLLQCAVASGILVAAGTLNSWLSARTWQRIWKRFNLAQSKIRTALLGRCPPPESLPRPPTNPKYQAAAHVLAHLQAAFPDVNCPIVELQLTTRAFFM
jgi:hypothetical protein